MWAEKLESDIYVIDNIPFYAKSVALGDKFICEYIEDRLIPRQLYQESGNSTIRVVSNFEERVQEYREEFKKIGCQSELSELGVLFSLNIPFKTNYIEIKEFLELREKNGSWSYEVGCLSSIHSGQSIMG